MALVLVVDFGTPITNKNPIEPDPTLQSPSLSRQPHEVLAMHVDILPWRGISPEFLGFRVQA